jgi:MoxR-like ATPase
MSVTQLTLGSKSVLLHEPYAPPEEGDGEFVGRIDELKLLLTGWIARPGKPPFAPLLIGEPGVGKTRLAYQAARLSGRDLFVFSGNDDVTAQELAVSVVSSGDSDNFRFEYVLSPLATAMVQGGVCLIDELGELRPSALAFLLPLLDGQHSFYSPLLGKRITADPRFRFVATMNHTDPLAATLNGNHKLSRRLRPVIEVGEFTPAEIQQLIGRRFPASQDNPRLLSRFWKCWRQCNEGTAPTPWDAIYVFGMAENIATAERLERDGSWSSLEAAEAVLETRHIEAAFEQALGAVRTS